MFTLGRKTEDLKLLDWSGYFLLVFYDLHLTKSMQTMHSPHYQHDQHSTQYITQNFHRLSYTSRVVYSVNQIWSQDNLLSTPTTNKVTKDFGTMPLQGDVKYKGTFFATVLI